MNIKKAKILFILFILFGFANSAHAASLYLTSDDSTLGVGQEFEVLMGINSKDSFINAAQATITFPVQVLEVVSVDRTGSVFNFWVEEPTFSNEEGIITLIGGTAKGVSGESLEVLSVRFKAKGSGVAEIIPSDVIVTASDGKGTNVLSSIEAVSVAVGVNVIVPEIEPIPTAQRETPSSVVLSDKPQAPELDISLYPDQGKWYSRTGDVVVSWNLPSDVTNIAISLDDEPYTSPPASEGGLLSGKTFEGVGEGVWYVHVQFKNSKGWGEETHYKIAIDATSPIPFEIIGVRFSDSPTAEINFETEDELSGVSNSLVFVDGVKVLETTEKKAKLPAQAPGIHNVIVRVFDNAGNSIEDDYEFEILPIESPVIDFISSSVSQGDLIFVSGKSIPSTFIEVYLADDDGSEVFTSFVSSEPSGNWEMVIKEHLPLGNYTLKAIARDDRGAQSYPSEAEYLRVKAKTILSIGPIDIGWFEILSFIILIITSMIGLFSWYYLEQQKKRQAYFIIARRDIKKLTTLLLSDLTTLRSVYKSQKELSSEDKVKVEHHLDKMEKTTTNMNKYLGRELKKLK